MIKLYSKQHCPACMMTKMQFEHYDIPHEEIDASTDETAKDYIRNELGYQSLPVVVVNDNRHWSGFRIEEIERLADEYKRG